MSISDAEEAMRTIESKPFSPYWAENACEAYEGVLVHHFEPALSPVRSSALWKAYRFPDGSMINIDKHGCSAFSPQKTGVKYRRITNQKFRNTLW